MIVAVVLYYIEITYIVLKITRAKIKTAVEDIDESMKIRGCQSWKPTQMPWRISCHDNIQWWNLEKAVFHKKYFHSIYM